MSSELMDMASFPVGYPRLVSRRASSNKYKGRSRNYKKDKFHPSSRYTSLVLRTFPFLVFLGSKVCLGPSDSSSFVLGPSYFVLTSAAWLDRPAVAIVRRPGPKAWPFPA